MKIKTVRYITSLDDIALLKKQLKKKIAKQEVKILESFNSLKDVSTSQNIYNEILEGFNVKNSLLTLLPLALKYKDLIVKKVSKMKSKNTIWAVAGGLGVALLGYFYYRNSKKATTESTEGEDVEETEE